MYIILNNFLLNSAWFLEQSHNPNREVVIELVEEEYKLVLYMENNGPVLAEKFKDNPDKIFEMGETSKGQSGTGLGLWVVRETVERNNGTITVMDKRDGFGLKISFKREDT
jgi:sensor histidine kinase regulating citrate/malate metabolism